MTVVEDLEIRDIVRLAGTEVLELPHAGSDLGIAAQSRRSDRRADLIEVAPSMVDMLEDDTRALEVFGVELDLSGHCRQTFESTSLFQHVAVPRLHLRPPSAGRGEGREPPVVWEVLNSIERANPVNLRSALKEGHTALLLGVDELNDQLANLNELIEYSVQSATRSDLWLTHGVVTVDLSNDDWARLVLVADGEMTGPDGRSIKPGSGLYLPPRTRLTCETKADENILLVVEIEGQSTASLAASAFRLGLRHPRLRSDLPYTLLEPVNAEGGSVLTNPRLRAQEVTTLLDEAGLMRIEALRRSNIPSRARMRFWDTEQFAGMEFESWKTIALRWSLPGSVSLAPRGEGGRRWVAGGGLRMEMSEEEVASLAGIVTSPIAAVAPSSETATGRASAEFLWALLFARWVDVIPSLCVRGE